MGHNNLIRILENCKNAFLPQIRKCNYLFVNQNYNVLSDQSIGHMFNKYTSLVVIELHITPHMFQHTFSASLLEADVDIRFIQEMLGHSSINITKIYTHVATKRYSSCKTIITAVLIFYY